MTLPPGVGVLVIILLCVSVVPLMFTPAMPAWMVKADRFATSRQPEDNWYGCRVVLRLFVRAAATAGNLMMCCLPQ